MRAKKNSRSVVINRALYPLSHGGITVKLEHLCFEVREHIQALLDCLYGIRAVL